MSGRTGCTYRAFLCVSSRRYSRREPWYVCLLSEARAHRTLFTQIEKGEPSGEDDAPANGSDAHV
jgi:hypothetical protein